MTLTGPAHLPRRLSISLWISSWIAAATRGEPYEDLDRCMRQLKDRGFNCLRAEAGLNWAFRLDGTPRGEVEFGPWIAGHGWNTVSAKGGGRHDILERLRLLMELARKHDVFVILTSWEYQDSSWFVADPAIRSEVFSVPLEKRFLHLAQQFDRLLKVLEARDLHRHLAFIEVHNEPDVSEFPAGCGIYQPVEAAPEASKRLHEEAIAFLRASHPDTLVSADFTKHEFDYVPDNAQVFDQHIYAGWELYWKNLYPRTIFHPDFDPRDPLELPALREILRPDWTPWDEFMKPARNVREFWRPIMWLYENLDNQKWDRWVAQQFPEVQARMIRIFETRFAADAAEARRRNWPLVFDEGGFWYPPRLSRFELSPPALGVLERMCDLAIAHGYWGFMPGTYCAPHDLIWDENPTWLRAINARFQRS
jgi:hypothetical protein